MGGISTIREGPGATHERRIGSAQRCTGMLAETINANNICMTNDYVGSSRGLERESRGITILHSLKITHTVEKYTGKYVSHLSAGGTINRKY